MSARRTPVVVLATAMAALAVPGVAGASTALHPTWRATGPPPGLADTLGLASRQGTTFVLTYDYGRNTVDAGDVAGFWLRGPDGVRTGRLPASRNFMDDDDIRPEIAAPGVVVVPIMSPDGDPTLQRTGDGGRTWHRVGVPGCPTPGEIGASRAYDLRGGGVMTRSAAPGCVWRTEDAGAHWHVVARGVDATGVAWVGGQSYVAVGGVEGASYGTGPLRSDDGGRTWTGVALPPRPAAAGEAPRPTVPVAPVVAGPGGRVLIGTADGGLLESVDDGRTFARRAVVPPNVDEHLDDVRATAVLPGGDALVGGGPDPDPQPRKVVGPAGPADLPAWLRPLRPIVVDGDAVLGLSYRRAGDRYALHRIVGGRDTELVGGRNEAGMGTGTLAAYVRDGVLWTSRDSGAHWTRRRPPAGVRPRVVAADGPDDVVLDRTGRLWRVDAGRWRALTRGPHSGLTLMAVARGVPVVGGRRGLLRLEGRRLRPVGERSEKAEPVVVAADGRRIVAVSVEGVVTRSADGGRRWSRGATMTRYVDGADVSGRTVLVVSGGRARRSVDGGRTFSRGAALPARRASGSAERIGRVSFLDRDHVVVAEQAHLVVSADGGRTFRPVALPYAAGPLEAVWTRGGVLAQDDISHDLLRTPRVGGR